MKRIILFFVLILSIGGHSQDQISLDACYELVSINYPLAKQGELLNQKNALELEVIDAEKLPQLNLTAQATYQSDVIAIPIPNSGVEPPNNDQYRATLNVNQLIYGGGAIDAKTNLKNAVLNTQQKQLEVNLYQLKKQINQIYFSIILTQERHSLLTSKQAQLQTKLKEVQSGIKNGMVLPSSDKIIEAELLKIKLQFTEIEHSKESLIGTLSSLIGKNLSVDSNFVNPEIILGLSDSITRPELELFQLKKTEIETSEQLISKQNSPKFFGFANGGYGNPGLDPLDNSFQAFYTVGVRLNWNIFDWNSTKKQRQSIIINRDIVDTEESTFRLNTNIELNQLQTEMTKILDFIRTDAEIITLRNEVLKSAESQLKNGVITSSAYITELTNLYEDENNLSVHKIQFMLVKANYKITKGQ
ncbi:MAG: TolC family protein [Flavobacteriaceae bacterium]|nr:TolC family protein [Flavobacteriaceae bacterium]